jgi:putative acetyltransferase
MYKGYLKIITYKKIRVNPLHPCHPRSIEMHSNDCAVLIMNQSENYIFKLITKEEDFRKARNLFIEYANSLDFDLHFQNFETELNEIDIQYNKPDGGLILIINRLSGEEVGCAGIRKSEDKIAELKRMFIKEPHRNKGLGKELMRKTIKLAKDLGYEKIRLDTLDTMKPAMAVYEKYGFRQTGAYRYNPFDNVRFYELIL